LDVWISVIDVIGAPYQAAVSDAESQIDRRGGKRLVPHGLLDGDKICSGLIKMKTECVPKTVEVKATFRHAGFVKSLRQNPANGFCRYAFPIFLTGKEPVILCCAAIGSSDIGHQKIIRFFGENRIPVRTILAAGDINAVFGFENVATMQAAKFTDPDTGGIQQCDLCLVFEIVYRINDR
jgi:hypothetical protein